MFSKLCKYKCKTFLSNLIEDLDNLFENDPKANWSLLDDLKENKRESCDLMTSPDDMHDHFSSLNKITYKFKHRAKE